MTVEREACPSCGEPVALEARVCPYCERSLLVDVWLEAPITDGRQRYQVARSLQSLGPPVPAFPELQTALAAARPIAVRGANRAFARHVQEMLEASGAGTVLRFAASGGKKSSTRALPVAAIAAAALVLVGAGWWAWKRTHSETNAPPVASKLPTAPSPAASTAPTPLSTKELARRVLPSTASLRCPNSVGAGFFVAPDLLLTNAHVLCAEGERIKVVFSDHRELSGDAVRRDPALDLALVRVEGAEAKPLPLGDAGNLSVGEKVILVGSPLALEFSLSEGTVSNLSRPVLGVSYIQINAGVNPGNSGGPLFNDQGRVVGIISLKHAAAEGIGLVLPINYAYTGEQPFVAAPDAAGGSTGFEAMVAEAEAENKKAAHEISGLSLQPGLVGARVDQYRRLVVHVLRPARSMPPFEEITVKVLNNQELICNLKGDVREWKLLENRQLNAEMDERVRAWLDKIGFDIYLYLGESPLRFDLCPFDRMTGNVTLEMEGADPSASKLRVLVR